MAKPKPKSNLSENKLTFGQFKVQAWVLVIIGFIFYANSLSNQYALDDTPLIKFNTYVDKGLKGIPKILTTDSYQSYYEAMGSEQQLAGGRYRPLSAVMFAIEQQILGSNPKDRAADDLASFRHFGNIALYLFSIVVLLYFLRNYIFKEDNLIPFITCFIFLIHPIHSEVVANIKSRDEILSFLFIILTFIAVFRYKEGQKKQLWYALLFYVLAFLSKEYAITLLALIPMLLYIVKRETFKQSVVSTIPFFVVAIVYVMIRYKILGVGSEVPNPDILNAPYNFATPSQALATKIEVLLRYVKLMFYPFPLSSDYSYNTIPYTDFGAGKVWLSIIIHLSMIVATIYLFVKRNILSFALAFYLLHLFLVSNLIFDIGATMGERLVYHSSFGFALILAIGINEVVKKLGTEKTRKTILAGVGSLVMIWCGAKVMARNPDWKNDITLFIADSKTVPNSAFAAGFAGQAYLTLAGQPENQARNREYIDSAFVYLNKAISLHKTYVQAHINLGAAYLYSQQYDKAEQTWNFADSLYPNNPQLKINFKELSDTYYRIAQKYGPTDKKAGVLYMQKALAIDSLNTTYKLGLAEAYYNMGMSYGENNAKEALPYLERAAMNAPGNALYWYNLGGANYTLKDYERAKQAWTKTLELDPNNQGAKQGLGAIPQ